jgi:hypothetical protein
MELNEILSESRKKRQKRRRTIWLVITITIVIVIISGFAWLIAKSPFVRVDRIVVQGNNEIPTDELVTFADNVFAKHHGWLGFLGIHNMLAWPTTVSSSDLTSDYRLAAATLSKSYLAHNVTLAVTERQPVAVWCFMPVGFQVPMAATPIQSSSSLSGALTSSIEIAPAPSVAIIESESCYWFDATGTMFEPAFDAEGNLLLAVHDYSQKDPGLGQSILPAHFVQNLFSVLTILRASGLRLKEIRLNEIGLEELQVMTYNGPNVNFSLRFPADDTLSIIRTLMAKPGFGKLQYVDFRTQDRAYYE